MIYFPKKLFEKRKLFDGYPKGIVKPIPFSIFPMDFFDKHTTGIVKLNPLIPYQWIFFGIKIPGA